MAYSIDYLPEAYDDIDHILDYLSQFYPNTASNFYTTLQGRIGQLADNPYMAEICEYDTEFRRLLVNDYLVFYTIFDDAETVEIHRVLRASWNQAPR